MSKIKKTGIAILVAIFFIIVFYLVMLSNLIKAGSALIMGGITSFVLLILLLIYCVVRLLKPDATLETQYAIDSETGEEHLKCCFIAHDQTKTWVKKRYLIVKTKPIK